MNTVIAPLSQVWRLGLLASLLIGLAGCSTVEVSQDYARQTDFDRIQTLAWLPAAQQTPPKAAEFARQNPLIAQRIEQAIASHLQARGLTLTDSENPPDAYLTYHASTEQELSGGAPFGTTIGIGTGTGRTFGSVFWRAYPDWETYNQSVLKIDLLTPDQQLIWRGIGTTRLPDHPTPETLDERITEMVQTILMQYPPNAAKQP
ncbi:DUF4136 domain-containing protein [Thiomicrospira sp. WB1]|uniref:DUF4136 domain-containing protein n=1 Tax=Thiomicrospira sp. WB1 TaxID=1685380 RepID=UPI000838BF9E|nr:DUF4136 domain-containing protein [Thiomicrospira sp. WB1]